VDFKFGWLLAAGFFCSASTFGQTDARMGELVQKLEGTLGVSAFRETADGVLRACGMEFTAMKRDFSTKQGALVKVTGSFSLRPNKNSGLAYVLKLGVFDGPSFQSAIAPNNAFIVATSGSVPPKAIRFLGENPGFALFVGGVDQTVTDVYKDVIDKGILSIGFNRKPGEQDVNFQVDLAVIDTQINNGEVIRQRSGEPVASFVACTSDLLGKVASLVK
jgi:hypothetical protein